jgi:hypothetical protein
MATALEKKQCGKCHKGGGVTTCDGCQQSFCIKHIIEHRQELAVQMDNIGQEHDSLRRDLSEEDAPHPLLSQIDRWEEESIIKIQTAAKTARANLRQILNQTKNDIKISINKITDELQAHQELDDYTETDLNRWSTKLTNMRKLLETPSTIQIVEDDNRSNIIHLIKVLEKTQLHLLSKPTQISEKSLSQSGTSYGSTQEIFYKAMDGICLYENGLAAKYTGNLYYSYKTIFGKNLYCSGVHEIHFRIENKDIDNFFFGIITSTQDLVARIFDATTANGWWGFDLPVVDGKSQTHCGEKILLSSNDIVKLTLDCENRQIQFKNYRTNKILQLYINIKLCPFPWKIAVSLARPQDTLRILW